MDSTTDELRKLAEEGDAESQYRLGLLLSSDPSADLKAAFALIERAADKGHARAQCEQGRRLMNASGCYCDAAKALKLYRASAEQVRPT